MDGADQDRKAVDREGEKADEWEALDLEREEWHAKRVEPVEAAEARVEEEPPLWEWERWQASLDPGQFLQRCLLEVDGGAWNWGWVHEEVQEFLSCYSHALVALPRDHGKTTQVCGRLVWELGRTRQLRIKVVCATEAIATERGRLLREWLERQEGPRHEVFPQLRPDRPWRSRTLQVERGERLLGPSLATFGVGGGSTGTRADLLVCDDIVDVRAIRSRVVREWVCSYFHENLLNLLEPDGRCWLLFTPWHRDDLGARLQKNLMYGLLRRAVTHALDPVWPGRWNPSRLQARRLEVGSTAFGRGYRLVPIPEGETLMRPDWVRFWEEAAPVEQVVLAVDPAVSRSATADRSALVVLGRVRRQDPQLTWSEGVEVRVLACTARRVETPELLLLLEQWDRQWQPSVILFESNAAFAGLRDLLVQHRLFGGRLKSIVHTADKASRFAAFSVAVENGVFRLQGDGQGQPEMTQRELYDEMITFPWGEHDDLLDAAAMGCSYLLHRPEPRCWG
jgi:phage terminase large subunit-like protein